MDQEDRDVKEMGNINAIMKKLESGGKLTEEEKAFLKNPSTVKEDVIEKKDTMKVVEIKTTIGAGASNVDFNISLDKYLGNKRVLSSLKAQVNTKSFMLQGAQFFATMELLKEIKQIKELLTAKQTSEVNILVPEITNIVDVIEEEETVSVSRKPLIKGKK